MKAKTGHPLQYRSRLGFSGSGSRETSDSELSRTNLRSVPRLPTFLSRRGITAIILLATLCDAASAIDVEEVIWGFDGQVVPYRFNPVSLLISNTTEEAVAIELRLIRSDTTGGDRRGARIEESVFLSPYSSRWVQFYPFVSHQDEWSVSWGRLPSQRVDLQKPRIGAPARIALVEPNRIGGGKSLVKTLPDNLFPPLVSATENLEVLFLDYAPRWQQLRRQALIDWVNRGGTLFVTPAGNDEYPIFTSELAVLNSPLPELAIGQGVVIRADNRQDAIRMATSRLGDPIVPRLSMNAWNISEAFFFQLRNITTPDHHWPIIHVLSLIYLGLVFPGWYFLSRKPTDYRTTIAAFFGVALLFTIAFNVIGRRGYGESTTVNSVAIARQIENGSYDVLQWSNIFVTGGDTYELQHEGNGDLYSVGNTYETVNGKIDNGVDGSFVVDIPLFSSRSYIHRGKAAGPKLDVRLKEFEGGDVLNQLTLGVEPELLVIPRKFVVYRNRVYPMGISNGDLSVVQGRSHPINASLDKGFSDQHLRYNMRLQDKPSAHDTYRRLEDPLVARALGLADQSEVANFELPRDRVRLFLYSDIPDSFTVKHEELPAQQGKVLYVIDILLHNKFL